MSRAQSFAVLLACVAATGCERKQYPLRGLPFCATETFATASELEPAILIARGGSDKLVTALTSGTSGPVQTGSLFSKDELVVAIVSCAELPDVDGAWADQLDADSVPTVCGGQKTVFHGTLKATASPRAEALGYAGELRLPELSLTCSGDGKLVQTDDYTLGQKLDVFKESVDRFVATRRRLPTSWIELHQATKATALPLDPWGQRIAFSTTPELITLTSGGADGKLGTDDDIEVLTLAQGSANNILSFDGYHPAGDYDAFLKARGHSP